MCQRSCPGLRQACEAGAGACLQRCTTSYVRLPPDYPKLQCSHRTPLALSLVNDIWVSVTSGSEDYSFKVRR
jgi:paired amphipathic helix protein Sin3a